MLGSHGERKVIMIGRHAQKTMRAEALAPVGDSAFSPMDLEGLKQDIRRLAEANRGAAQLAGVHVGLAACLSTRQPIPAAPIHWDSLTSKLRSLEHLVVVPPKPSWSARLRKWANALKQGVFSLLKTGWKRWRRPWKQQEINQNVYRLIARSLQAIRYLEQTVARLQEQIDAGTNVVSRIPQTSSPAAQDPLDGERQ